MIINKRNQVIQLLFLVLVVFLKVFANKNIIYLILFINTIKAFVITKILY